MAKTYYFSYMTLMKFKNSYIEAEHVGATLRDSVSDVLQSYGARLINDRRLHDLKREFYQDNELYHGFGFPDVYCDAFAGTGEIHVSFTNDNKLYIYLGDDPLLKTNTNDEIIEDIRRELVKNGILLDGASDAYPCDVEYKDKGAEASKGGCYVATAVYGSYDCPQVWTLRRYRDYGLAKTWYGRAFIRSYYAVSPTLVKWFGETTWFKKLWRGKLDRMVKRLNQEGYDDHPYTDMQW